MGPIVRDYNAEELHICIPNRRRHHQRGINGASTGHQRSICILTLDPLFVIRFFCCVWRGTFCNRSSMPKVAACQQQQQRGICNGDAGSTKCRHCGNIGNIHTATITMRIPKISINFHDVKRPTNRNKSMPSRPISDCICVCVSSSNSSFDFIHYARQMREESIDKHK